MKKVLRNYGLSIAFFLLFVVTIVAQTIAGLKEHNKEMQDEGSQQLSIMQYLQSGHFIQSTFENWESEFLQMALLVIGTIFLYQKGSSESNDPDEAVHDTDRSPDPKKKNVPWPVKKGGIVLAVYKHSLSLALGLLFILSFLLHWYGSLKDYNEEQLLKGKPVETATQYFTNSRLWFESFQNWQSEFLSIFVIVIFSVFLREKGSAQSKPVDMPHSETA